MNNYTFTFTGDSPTELLSGIKEFCNLLGSGIMPTVSENCVISAHPATPATAVHTTAPNSAQSSAAPAAPSIPTTTPKTAPVSPIPTAAAPAYTLDQIARATCVLSDADRVAEIRALFAQFGINALSDLQPDQYGAYATALRQMGVTI